MNLFEVYPRYPITPVRGEGCYVTDDSGRHYLDFYGGHAVISIGHSHPHYVDRIKAQLERLVFYSNSVELPQQAALADMLGELSGYTEHNLFLCNSGAEANENAVKVAGFHTGKHKIVAFGKAFHGRTGGVVAATDNPNIVTGLDHTSHVVRVDWGDLDGVADALLGGDVAAVMVEGIRGVGGIAVHNPEWWVQLRQMCTSHGACLIVDEVQSGYGRSGKFFAHQYGGISADIVTTAKGMGNGFPIGGVLIAPHITPRMGMLGSTFGGNPLACVAGLAVLEVMEGEDLMANANAMGERLREGLQGLPLVTDVQGQGLMLGIQLEVEAKELRRQLLQDFGIFTGSSAKAHELRLLPPLNIGNDEVTLFLEKIQTALEALAKDEAVYVGP